MKTLELLKLNSIKNRLLKHQPIAADDLRWLITELENTDFALEQVQAKLDRLKKAINDSQIAGTQGLDAIKRVLRNGEK